MKNLPKFFLINFHRLKTVLFKDCAFCPKTAQNTKCWLKTATIILVAYVDVV